MKTIDQEIVQLQKKKDAVNLLLFIVVIC